jgi:hypothetical protein
VSNHKFEEITSKMSSFSRFSLCFLAVVAIVGAIITTEENVLVLDDLNFEEATATHDQMLVEFYAPW